MAPANSTIKGIADLVGKKIGVAGGPLDKSWLLLRALARRSGVDLKTQAQIAYGAPPLLTQKALQGEIDATLTFWNFCAELEGKGMSRVVAMEDVVNNSAPGVPWRWSATCSTAAGRNATARCSIVSLSPRSRRKTSPLPAEWQRLAPRIGVDGADALEIYRRRYIEGIHAGRSPMKRPTHRRSTACSPRSAAPNSSARPRPSIPARSTARDRTNEPLAASRLGGAAARGVVCRLAHCGGRACCRSRRW